MPLSIGTTSLDLVRDTFVSVMFDKARASALFYERLFELAPETRPLFRSDLDEQRRVFIETLAKIIMGLDRLEAMLPDIQALAIRHVQYGVEERHYAVVGSALLHMVSVVSHPVFNPSIQRAWHEAYTLVSNAMLDACRVTPPDRSSASGNEGT